MQRHNHPQYHRAQPRIQVRCQTRTLPFENPVTRLLFLMGVVLLLGWSMNGQAATRAASPSVIYQGLMEQGLYANRSMQNLEFYRAMAAFEASEYALAERLLAPLAEKHYTEAEFYLGMFYDMGMAVAKAPKKAVYWYQRAAIKGYHNAQHNLAVAYAKGEGVQRDMNKALMWWQLAARQGNIDAQYNLGIVYATGNDKVERDLQQAEKWWRKAAISGDAMAQYNLGALYANGGKQLSSHCEAIRWWQASARSGVEQALKAIEVLKQRPDFHPC